MGLEEGDIVLKGLTFKKSNEQGSQGADEEIQR
jgi:hypothetical protein